MSIEAMKMALEALDSFDPYDSFASLWQQNNDIDIDKAITTLRQAIEQAEQMQPVPSIIQMLGHCPECGAKAHNFTAPPPRQPWVGLTDEEIVSLVPITGNRPVTTFARDVEAKLKEKNT